MQPLSYCLFAAAAIASAAMPSFAHARNDPGIAGNGLPNACNAFTDGRHWRVLLEPPPNAAELVAMLESTHYARVPDDRRPRYAEHWVADAAGNLGFCRVSSVATSACGEATMIFVRGADGRWTYGDGAVRTSCR